MISVVIPSYNGAETLFQAIDSVLCQTTKTPLEILVIDERYDGKDGALRRK